MAETLLIVGVVEHRELLIRTALERRLTLVIIDEAHSPMLQLAHIRVPVADLFDASELEAAFGRVLATTTPTGVLTLFDELLVPTAEFADRIACPFLSPQTALLAFNKVEQRAALARASVPIPRWEACTDLPSAVAAAGRIGYPVVLKVADQAGGIGKVRVAGQPDLEAAFGTVLSERLDSTVPLLVEEMVCGQKYSVEGFVSNGSSKLICISRSFSLPGNHPIEMAQAIPYHGPDADGVAEIAFSAAAAMGVDNSFFDIEVMATAAGPKLIEVNARHMGDRMMDLIMHATGVNPYNAILDLAFGLEPTWDRVQWNCAVGMRFVLPETTGIFTGMDGVPEVIGHPDTFDLGMDIRPGAFVGSARHNGDRLAWVAVQAPDWVQAEQSAAEAASRFSPRIVPPPAG